MARGTRIASWDRALMVMLMSKWLIPPPFPGRAITGHVPCYYRGNTMLLPGHSRDVPGLSSGYSHAGYFRIDMHTRAIAIKACNIRPLVGTLFFLEMLACPSFDAGQWPVLEARRSFYSLAS